MNITRIGNYAHQLTRFGLINTYLMQETDGLTLIDTGIGGSASDILKAAEAMQAGPIRRILLTHAHSDHIGSLDALCQHTSEHIGGAVGTPPEVAIAERESRLLAKKPKQDRSLDPGEAQCKIKGSLPGARTQATHLLSDGELYGSLRCVATPGHTPGHFSFLDERDGTLYSGDALVTVGGEPRVSGWAPWYFPLPNFATWHRPTARQSIQRLQEMNFTMPIARIAPGHGPIVGVGKDTFDSVLNQAR